MRLAKTAEPGATRANFSEPIRACEGGVFPRHDRGGRENRLHLSKTGREAELRTLLESARAAAWALIDFDGDGRARILSVGFLFFFAGSWRGGTHREIRGPPRPAGAGCTKDWANWEVQHGT